MHVEKYDWRSKIREAMGDEEPSSRSNKNAKESSSKAHHRHNWRFKKTIADAIELVETEMEAQREREAAEKARLDKARLKAMMVRDQAILPLLNGLRDNFAAHERKLLPEWRIRSDEDGDTFSGEAATFCVDGDGATRFTIRAEASVADLGEFVNLSVVCSSVDSKDTLASQATPLVEKTAKFPTIQKFDELSSRAWFHKQLAECVRICILTKMRQFPTCDADSAPPVLVSA